MAGFEFDHYGNAALGLGFAATLNSLVALGQPNIWTLLFVGLGLPLGLMGLRRADERKAAIAGLVLAALNVAVSIVVYRALVSKELIFQ